MTFAMIRDLISTAQLQELLDAGRAPVILDCRHDLAQPDWACDVFVDSHLPGAILASMDDVLSGPHSVGAGRHPWPSIEQWRAQLATWRITRDTPVVVYDQHSGMFAARAWWLLKVSGHDQVAVLDGGFRAWTQEGRLLESGVTQQEPAASLESVADIEFDRTRLLTAEQLVDARDAGRPIIDSRAADRYRGENETIDAKAGHIPGALNRPFGLNLLPDGRIKPADDLRRELTELLRGLNSDQAPVFYCGSGVTAAHNLLAMELAGLPGAAMYPPSWSGWIETADHPVATGEQP